MPSKAQVLLLRWMDNLDFKEQFQLFDVFCGQANVSKTWLLDDPFHAPTRHPSTHVHIDVFETLGTHMAMLSHPMTRSLGIK